MDLVPNEWFLDWLLPESNRSATVVSFVEKLEELGDTLVIRRKSKFTRKLYSYSKRYEARLRNPFKFFLRLLYHSPRVMVVDEDQIKPLPNDLKPPRKDVYLVELAYSTGGTLLTTDSKLCESIHGKYGIKAQMVDDFLQRY